MRVLPRSITPGQQKASEQDSGKFLNHRADIEHSLLELRDLLWTAQVGCIASDTRIATFQAYRRSVDCCEASDHHR